LLHVIIRAIIGDGPGRAWLRGTKGHAGYYACERCKIRGGAITLRTQRRVTADEDEVGAAAGECVIEEVSKRGIKFVDVGGAPRKDNEWGSYFNIERNEGSDKRMVHRVAPTPLDRLIGIKPISSFPVEEMHLVDGGAIKKMLEVFLKITDTSKMPQKRKKVVSSKKKKKAPPKKTPAPPKKKPTIPTIQAKDLAAWNCRMAVWSRLCTPKEFGRRLRTLNAFKIYKMGELRQLMLYYMIPLMVLDKTFSRRDMNIVLKFIKAYLLVTGNSYEEVPEEDLDESAKLFKEFFIGIKNLAKRACTYRMHGTWKHLVEDARTFKCRTTALSAYPFENQMRFFRQVCVFLGVNVLEAY
jgi:hypothetical protein